MKICPMPELFARPAEFRTRSMVKFCPTPELFARRVKKEGGCPIFCVQGSDQGTARSMRSPNSIA
ncbi:hypothetical protein, partial [Pseudoxanthomonas kaohsiungensis]